MSEQRSRLVTGLQSLRGVALTLLLCPVLAAQSTITFQYIYDDLNQLSKAIDSTGNVLEYIYDPVGNILQINRSTVIPGALSVFNITPLSAPTGTIITIQGQGFSINSALDIVTVGGAAATVIAATATTLVVTVPAAAVSGLIAVTVGGVTANSPGTETVIPAPIIISVKPRVMQAATTATITVAGANFVDTTFAIPGSGITMRSATATPDGTSVVLTLSANASAKGRFALVASNGAATSATGVSAANAFSAFVDPTLDPDGDGLPNALELIAGSDPYNADTDGDGYSDGMEFNSLSNPLDPNSTPLNTRLSGNAESVTLGISNADFTTSANGESDSITFTTLNNGATKVSPIEANSKTFGVLNNGANSHSPIEADSKTVSILDNLPTISVPAEADGLRVSVLNNPSGAASLYEANAILSSVCNTVTSSVACADYSGFSLVSKLQSTRRTPSAATGSGLRTAEGPANGIPFAVLAIAPAGDAVRIMNSTTVVLRFSTPLDPSSLIPANLSLSTGDRMLDSEIRYSIDFRTLTLTAALPSDATIQVRLTEQVHDIWGRQLTPFQSTFHTAGSPRNEYPAVTSQRPAVGATGVDPAAPIYFSFSNTTDWNRSRSALSITQNGDPVAGIIRVAPDGRGLEFTPDAPFHSGAVIKAAFDDPAIRYEGLFTTAPPPSAAPELLRAVPAGNSSVPRNFAMEFEYSRGLDRSTVTPDTITLSLENGGAPLQPLGAAVTLRGDRTIRVTPSAFLSPGSRYVIDISESVQDQDGHSVNPLRESAIADVETPSDLPRLVSVTPGDGTADVDPDTEIRLLFNRSVNPLTLDINTVRVSQDGVAVAVSASLGNASRQVILAPVARLKSAARVQVTISGVEDFSGNIMPFSISQFDVRKPAQAGGKQLANKSEAGHRRLLPGRSLIAFLTKRR